MKPQVVAGNSASPVGRRDRGLRFRNHRDLVGPAHSGEARADAFLRAISRRWPRLAVQYRRADRVSGSAVRRFRRRRRILDDDGRIRDCVKYQLPIKVIIIKNNMPGRSNGSRWFSREIRNSACELQPIDFAEFARACGARGYNDRGSRRLWPDTREGARDARTRHCGSHC